VGRKGEGTFSEVLKAQSIVTGQYCAVKCMKSHFKSLEQVNSLREIQALRRLNPHPNIIELQEVLYDKQSGRLALVFELMDCNIYEMIKGRRQYVKPMRVKMLMYQLLKAVAHMHANGIFHRDIKPENLLIRGDELKVADFGSCRGIYTRQPYTEYISTRWYRAPECLLTSGYYDKKMDMWGVGCVFFEIVALYPLFPGKNEAEQIERVHSIIGTPPPHVLENFRKHATHLRHLNIVPQEGTGIARLLPHASPDCIDLMEQMLIYDPEKRISAKQALKHPYFKELREADARAKQLQAMQQQMQAQKQFQSTLTLKPEELGPESQNSQTAQYPGDAHNSAQIQQHQQKQSPQQQVPAPPAQAQAPAQQQQQQQQQQPQQQQQRLQDSEAQQSSNKIQANPPASTVTSSSHTQILGSTAHLQVQTSKSHHAVPAAGRHEAHLNEQKTVHAETEEDLAIEATSKPLPLSAFKASDNPAGYLYGQSGGQLALTGGTSEYSGQLALPQDDNQEFVEEVITVDSARGGNLSLAAGVRIGQHYLQRQQAEMLAQQQKQLHQHQHQQQCQHQHQNQHHTQHHTQQHQYQSQYPSNYIQIQHYQPPADPSSARKQGLGIHTSSMTNLHATSKPARGTQALGGGYSNVPVAAATGARSKRHAAPSSQLTQSNPSLTVTGACKLASLVSSGQSSLTLGSSPSSTSLLALAQQRKPNNATNSGTGSCVYGTDRSRAQGQPSTLSASYSTANLLGARTSAGAGQASSNLANLVLSGTNPLHGSSLSTTTGSNASQSQTGAGGAAQGGTTTKRSHAVSVNHPSVHPSSQISRSDGTSFTSSHLPIGRSSYLNNTTIQSSQLLRQPYAMRAPLNRN